MSLIMTQVHLGFGDHFVLSAIKAFFHGIVVALPVGIFIGPLIRHILDKIPRT
jgi:uncharacterized protein DUF2798